MGYTYNRDGSRSSLMTPAGAISYRYDNIGRIVEVGNDQLHAARYAYRPTGTDTGPPVNARPGAPVAGLG